MCRFFCCVGVSAMCVGVLQTVSMFFSSTCLGVFDASVSRCFTSSSAGVLAVYTINV